MGNFFKKEFFCFTSGEAVLDNFPKSKVKISLGLITCSICSITQAELPNITADKPIVFDNQKNCLVAEGNAEFNHNSLCVQADNIYFFQGESKAFTDSNVRLTRENLRMVSEAASYYLRDRNIDASAFRLEANGHGISGDNARGTLENLDVDHVRVYYHGKHWAGLNIMAQKGTLHVSDSIELHNALLRLGYIPLFFAPYYKYKFQESTVRWKADIGLIKRSNDYGRYIRNDVLFNMGWPVKPGLMFDYYRKRDYLWGGILEYESDSFSGKFKGVRIHDEDASNLNLKNPRFYIDWQHQQSFGEQTDFVSQVRWLKDADVIKDFRPDDHDGLHQHPDNFAEVAHRTENTVSSALVRYRFNHFQCIQERLPELRFDYLPVPLGETPFYYQWGVGVSHLREKPITQSPTELSERELRRADTFFGLSMPCDIAPWCTWTPLVGGRAIKYWGLPHPGYKDYERYLGQIGFDLRFKTYGEYDFESDYWNIHGLRHLMMPVVQYRYIPNGHAGHQYIPAIDRENDSVKDKLYEIDLLNRRDLDDFNEMHLIRVGLENYVYTNFKSGNPSQWFRLNLYQDFRLKRSDQQTTLSDFFIDTEWSPSSFFSWSATTRIQPNEKRLKEFETSISFHENDLWRLSFTHNYELNTTYTSATNQETVSLAYRLNAQNTIAAAISIDAHKPDLIRQTYTWSTIVADTWKIDTQFKWTKRSQSDKASKKDAWEIRFIVLMCEY